MVVHTYRYIIQLLVLVAALIVFAIFMLPDGNLHVVACDVGQGDAILIIYKNIQILTDGGPDDSVLKCLERHVPFYDREIELVISTHPDADHSTGLVDVIKRYKVDKILINSLDPGTQIYELLKKAVGSRGVGVVNPERGMGLRLDMIYLDIVHPDSRSFSDLILKNSDSGLAKYSTGNQTNLYSIVYYLSFKRFTGFFPGDIPKEESDLISSQPGMHHADYIKTPHHGSSNGVSDNLLKAIEPKFAVISVGRKNLWGFPSSSVLQMLKDHNVRVFRTDEVGDLEMITDGDSVWWKN